MAAATTALEAQQKTGLVQTYKLGANKKVFKGTLVVVNDADGFLEPGTDATGKTFVGVAYESGDNNPGSAGDVLARVYKSGSFLFSFSGTLNQATIGKPTYIVDDNTVALAATTTNDVLCGYIVGIEGTKARVRIDLATR